VAGEEGEGMHTTFKCAIQVRWWRAWWAWSGQCWM